MHTLNIDEEIGMEENTMSNSIKTDTVAVEVEPLKKA